jgi:predicted thioesterase
LKPIPPDARTELKVVVSDEMTVEFESLGPVHPVYSTYFLAKHMEEVSRTLVLPYLEDGEEGIGHVVNVRHLSSALPGMTVTLTGTNTGSEDGRRVVVSCRAVSELGDVVGEGETVQVVVAEDWLQQRFDELRTRWEPA